MAKVKTKSVTGYELVYSGAALYKTKAEADRNAEKLRKRAKATAYVRKKTVQVKVRAKA